MAQAALVLLLVTISSKVITSETPRRMIVWNVGQGSWATAVEDVGCLHFDAGGERAPWSEIMSLCRGRSNLFYLSHWDWDHISFLRLLSRYLPDSCLAARPNGDGSPRKRAMLARLSDCSIAPRLPTWTPERARTSNEASRVMVWQNVVLPGDSPSSRESEWLSALPDARSARVLVLGHHGSRTSTSKELLNQTRFRLSIASARRARYGHPHNDVVRKLERAHVPLLRTEDWGHIVIWF